MSTHINDFASAVAVYQSVAPSEQTETFDGDTVDLISSDGDCFAIQQIGAFAEGPSLAGRIEESADDSSWSAISGATFSAVTENNNTQVIRFRRTARYVRYAATITGSDPEVSIAVVIGEQRKTF